MSNAADSTCIYWDDKGNTYTCTARQAAVFTLIDKLGLKSSPIKHCTMWVTNSFPQGNYIISTSMSGVYINVDVTVQAPTYSTSYATFDLEEAKMEDVKVSERKPTKEMRREWRSNAKHARNTGRNWW